VFYVPSHNISTHCLCQKVKSFIPLHMYKLHMSRQSNVNSHHICTKLSSAPFKMPVVKSTFDDRCYNSNRKSLFYFSRSIFYCFQVVFFFLVAVYILLVLCTLVSVLQSKLLMVKNKMNSKKYHKVETVAKSN
jgi:hypothetical protein